MLDLNIPQLIIRGIIVIISLTIHEYAHGLVSQIQGDKTPENYGRLTLNPLDHMELFGLISLLLFPFGWAKPMPINSKNYKNKRAGIIMTSLAGPLSNVLLLIIGSLLEVFLYPKNEIVTYFLEELIFINTSLAIFNMIPIAPLDGSKIFAELFGGKIADLIYRLDRKGLIILIFILWIPQVNIEYSILINEVGNFVKNFLALIVLHHTIV